MSKNGENKHVYKMVMDYLKSNGFDGLFSEDGHCACLTEDFNPCGEICGDCEAGYKRDCPTGNCEFHICRSKDPLDEVECDL